ncbi:MAG: extracellular solute-binding protein [Rubrivivax sp.]|jgi:ABC-type glycerol-3-phosphate transport system substrate-binding protein|nr:extracellular solute-binding protein [Rubrivivax sp.]
MTLRRRSLLLATAAAPAGAHLGTRASGLACPNIGGTGEVHLIGNSFPAVAHIAAIAEGCARPGFKVVFKLTPQARVETEQAFGAEGRSPFDAAVVSMGVFSNLYARRQLQPLSDLVQTFGSRYRLEEKMLVRVDGEVMAIAFMQNTQNLYYRADLFAKHRLAVPADYAQMVQAAAVLQRQEPSITFPIAQGFAKGFDCATEFTNILAGLGGRFFQPGGALPAFNGADGVQAVAVMRSLMPYMTPNALASNSDDVVNQFQQGKAAMGVLWASRASRMDDATASKVVGQMAFAAAPAARAGGRGAAHLWWDAVVLPRNNPRQREATFHVLMEGLSEAAVKTGNDLGIWVRSVYSPGRFGTGVALSQRAGAPVWPSEPFFSLAHGEVGKLLPEALAGERTPQAVLDAAAAAYLRSATEKGFIRRGATA